MDIIYAIIPIYNCLFPKREWGKHLEYPNKKFIQKYVFYCQLGNYLFIGGEKGLIFYEESVLPHQKNSISSCCDTNNSTLYYRKIL